MTAPRPVDNHQGERWVVEIEPDGAIGLYHWVPYIDRGELKYERQVLVLFTSKEMAEAAIEKYVDEHSPAIRPRAIKITDRELKWILLCGASFRDAKHCVYRYCYDFDAENLFDGFDFYCKGEPLWEVKP